MKKCVLASLLLFAAISGYSQKMQATIKPGNVPGIVDIYLKSSETFAQKDDAMTFVLAIPASISPAPVLKGIGATANGIGRVSRISGLQPNILENNLGSTKMEVVVSKQSFADAAYYIYTFIFAGTAANIHHWTAGVEQKIFSIQFNGCTSNCEAYLPVLVNLPKGGSHNSAYWYFQPNTLGDITNYAEPFYENPQSTSVYNGGSFDGSALSKIGIANQTLPVIFSRIKAYPSGKDIKVEWSVSAENNLSKYEVEKSANGIDFHKSTEIIVKAEADKQVPYSWLDMNPANGQNFYRIKAIEQNNSIKYSSIANVTIAGGKDKIAVFPNFNSRELAIVVNNIPKGKYSFMLYNTIGQKVTEKEVQHSGGNLNVSLKLSTELSQGVYNLIFSDGVTSSSKSVRY